LGSRARTRAAMAVSLLMIVGVKRVPLFISSILRDTIRTHSSLTLPEMNGTRANFPSLSNWCGEAGIKLPSILGAKMNLDISIRLSP
jgi:hypothetical protein